MWKLFFFFVFLTVAFTIGQSNGENGQQLPDIQIRNNTTTSKISGEIVNGTVPPLLNISGPGKEKYEISLNGTRFMITNLTAGQCYTIQAIQKNISSNPIRECTKPSAPAEITVQSETTTSISINIQHGTGKVEYFDLKKDKEFIKQYNASAKENTSVTIYELIPGTSYNSFTIIAISHGRNSSSTKVPSLTTKPSAPAKITVQSETTTSISINIKHGIGMVEYFVLKKDEKFIKQYNASAKENTNVTIDELTPGTSYNSFTIIAISHGRNSSFTKVPSLATNPNPPKGILRDGRTSRSIKINILHGNGPQGYFDILINGIYHSSVQLQQDHPDSTRAEITGLIPGTMYDNIAVLTVKNGQNSTETTMDKYATYPEAPAAVDIVEPTGSNIVKINITQGEGTVEAFQVYVNGTINLNVSNSDSTVYVIKNVLPGRQYWIEVSSFSNRLTSTEKTGAMAATRPAIPILQINDPDVTTTQISGTVEQKNGGMDRFHVYSKELNSTYITNGSNFVISNLDPGKYYHLWARAIFQNETSNKTDTIKVCTVPNPPKLAIDNQSSMDTLHGRIFPQSAGFDNFNILCNGTRPKFSIDKTSFIIHNLKPGTLYKCQASTIFCNHTSKSSAPKQECTVPSSPLFSIDKQATSINAFHGNISQKTGGKDKFTIHCNGTEKLNISIHGSKYAINNLKPGIRYSCLASTIFCNHISKNTSTIQECTVPNPPHFTIDKKSTTMYTFRGSISQLTGGKDKFTLYCNGTQNLNISIDGSKYSITGLTAGTRYSCQAATTFCNHTSEKTTSLEECTVPDIPSWSIDRTTNSTFHGSINQMNGGHDRFTIHCNGTERSNVIINGSNYFINNLEPGTRYSCHASTTFCNHTRKDTDPQEECTIPNPPTFTIDNQFTTINSFRGSILQQSGGKDSFTIHCNGTENLNFIIDSSKYFIKNLTPGKRYYCQASTTFCGHTSDKSYSLKQCTVPFSPNFTIDSRLTTISTFHGSIFQLVGGKDKFKIYCNGTQNLIFRFNGSKYSITGLTPGTKYNCQAATMVCNHTSEKTTSLEECTVPSSPNFTIDKSTIKTLHGSIHSRNGESNTFTIICNHTNKLNYTINNGRYNIYNLEPGSWYSCKATTKFCSHNSDYTTPLQESTVPSTPKSVTVPKSSNETMNLDVNKGNGGVQNYDISFQPISKAKCAGKLVQRTGKLVQRNGKQSMTIDSLSAGTIYNISILSIFNNKHSSPYIMQHATDPSPPVDVRIKDRKKDSATIEIVKGRGCVKRFVVSVGGIRHNITASKDTNVTVYSISGLDSATFYPIKVYAVSNGAYNLEMSSIQISLTTENDPVPVAIGVVVGVLAALIVILTVVFSWRRQALCFKKNIPKEVVQGNMNSGFEEEVELADTRRKRPVKLSDFHRHVEMMSRNTHMQFSQEFKELGILSPKLSTDISQIQENRPKNRYTNILPFDHSIVKLIGVEDEIGSDFINANYIPGKKSKREFIATQGPLPSTKEEMWRMIWEQNVSIVVMLTQLMERGRKKCEIYWPENVNEKMFLGEIIVEVVTISHLPNYTLRTITLQLGDVERRIKHYNYLAWPDMGTPKTTDIMINFVDAVRKEVKPNMKGPIVVHCSAGVGRTGTFIMMDILLQEIRSKCTEVDIFGMILNMRNYRLNMVQTEDQYIFIHNCVKDLIDVSDDEEEEEGVEEQHEPIYQNC